MDALTTKDRMTLQWPQRGGWLVWGLFALALVVAPLVFNKGASLSILSQIGTAMIFGLSYNMLLGQGGMLSFGHAVYSGLGAFCAVHAMNLAAAGAIWMPVSLVPLAGGFAGMTFGMLFGYVTTRKAGTAFAMITLGMGELVFACSLMFPGFFGGEGGISTNRVYGEKFLGITYGPQMQVYYLVACWLFLSTIGMYAFTRTPLGRIIHAVRDNPERVGFIGYDAQWARYLTLILSGFFAGISGALAAINFEIVTAENLSAMRSGVVLLFTFIGGTGYFFGPMIGAVVGVFMTVLLSGFTKAWPLYLGVFFILVVMYAPGGIAHLIMLSLRVARFGKFGCVGPRLCAVSAMAMLVFLGTVMAVEMLYHLTLVSLHGREMQLFGFALDSAASSSWLLVAGLLIVGSVGFWRTKPGFQQIWNEVNRDIDTMLQRVVA